MFGKIIVKWGARRRQYMRKISVVAASMLVLSGVMLAKVTMAQVPMVNGEVTKIDESAGKITLRHGAIKKLDMNEGMAMVFRVQDPAMLKQVKVGDKVRFDADRINGQFTVTKIERVK
jgi:Cu/Ag efflux protein CusF